MVESEPQKNMTPENDCSYLESYGSRKQYRMPTCFEKDNFKEGQLIRFRITQIYDPSKFWIVLNYEELECFQKYLFRWYYINRNNLKVPLSKMEKEMYCVVFIDGGYYRGILVGVPYDTQKEQEVQIYFIDYGMLRLVGTNNIYYMSRKCAEVVQYAIRASLAGICPRTGHQWSEDDVMQFHSLVQDKILVGVVINVDCERQVLEMHFSEEKNGVLLIPIHKTLIAQKRARHFHDREEAVEDKAPFQPKLKFAYLFPSHEALESGKIPLTVGDAAYQMQIASSTSILSRYYKNRPVCNGQSLN